MHNSYNESWMMFAAFTSSARSFRKWLQVIVRCGWNTVTSGTRLWVEDSLIGLEICKSVLLTECVWWSCRFMREDSYLWCTKCKWRLSRCLLKSLSEERMHLLRNAYVSIRDGCFTVSGVTIWIHDCVPQDLKILVLPDQISYQSWSP